ncbi:unnamed protein product [Mytilus coruscus]|uniref:Integrase catalytic domain-containing protein n=1 Tax=Mytilus coruscus TaxID=42192 RepID=A0A6J8AJ12_MYTCO|nr:unnamed protein product [Mytilus coruscus]
MLNKIVQDISDQWDTYLPRCVFSYNTSKQSSTRFSPFFLMYWRNPILPNENQFGETTNTFSKYIEISPEEIEKGAEKMNEIQKHITKDVIDHVHVAQARQKTKFDERKNVAVNQFNEGELVLVKNQRRKKHLGKSLWLGPFKITGIPRVGTMKLEDKNGDTVGTYRQHNLKKYYPPTETVISDQQENDKDKHEDSDGDKTDENNNTETHHEVENKSNERESVDDNKYGENNNGDILNDNDIFITQ